MTGKFGFVVHPTKLKEDAVRHYGWWVRLVPTRLIESILARKKPILMGYAPRIESPTGAVAEGWFVACPLTARQMLWFPLADVYARITAACHLAADQGAKIIGLGAFTSVVGDKGITIAQCLASRGVAVTTGNSYTVVTAIEALKWAGEKMGIMMDLPTTQIAIFGATGSIGQACAKYLLWDTQAQILLLGRNPDKLEKLKDDLIRQDPEAVSRVAHPVIFSGQNFWEKLSQADLVLAVSSAIDQPIKASYLKPGAVVCDVARPRNVSWQVARARDDVLVFDGGVVQIPGPSLDLGFDFGFPQGTTYACMAETIILALEERYENFSLGDEISVDQAREIQALAKKHGFSVAALRAFERPVSEEQIERIRANAVRKGGQR